jgi:PAS domain S-box-containing protein
VGDQTRQHRESLWQSHAFTNQLIGALGEAVLGLDPDHRVLFANPVAEQMLGWDEADLLGRRLDERVILKEPGGRPFDMDRFHTNGQTDKASPVRRADLTLTNRKGAQFDVETVATSIYQSGDRTGMVFALRDITPRNKARDELTRLATTVEQAAEMILITDVRGIIDYVNPAFERVTGFTREEAVGRNCNILKSDKHDKEVYRDLWETITLGRVWRGRLTNKRKDGSFFEIEETISPVFDSSGKIMNYAAVMRDITTEVVLEKHLRESQKLEGIARLAGGVAHDFNNLLTTVMGNLEIARAKAPQEVQKFLDNAEKACVRGASLVHQMLLYSRESEPKAVPLDPNRLVEEVVSLVRQSVDRRIEVVAQTERNCRPVKADPGQLHQVLLNLILNARDAIEERVEQLTAHHSGQPSSERFLISVCTELVEVGDEIQKLCVEAEPGEYTRLTVSDNGSGMTRETLDHVFEPFFTTKPEGKGTGLGLSSVYGIVANHGGWIDVLSEEEVGSTFSIYLPAIEADALPAPPARKLSQLRGGKETLLVVDDDEALREVTVESLRTFGYTTLEAGDGKEALEVFDRHRSEIDLVILDLSLPKLSGREVYQYLRHTDQNLKVLVASGYPPKVRESDGSEWDWTYVQKPYRVPELARVIREVLDQTVAV